MKPEDSESVARLATQLGYPSTPTQIEARFQRLGEAPDSRVLVAVDTDGRVLAWIHVFGTRQIESDPGAEIGGLVVDEKERGRGFGTLLMERAEEWARERGYLLVSVRSNVIRVEAHEFYKSLGYEMVKSQFRLRKRLQ